MDVLVGLLLFLVFILINFSVINIPLFFPWNYFHCLIGLVVDEGKFPGSEKLKEVGIFNEA